MGRPPSVLTARLRSAMTVARQPFRSPVAWRWSAGRMANPPPSERLSGVRDDADAPAKPSCFASIPTNKLLRRRSVIDRRDRAPSSRGPSGRDHGPARIEGCSAQAPGLHQHRTFALSDNLPVVIEIVDQEDKLRAFVQAIEDLAEIGLADLRKGRGAPLWRRPKRIRRPRDGSRPWSSDDRQKRDQGEPAPQAGQLARDGGTRPSWPTGELSRSRRTRPWRPRQWRGGQAGRNRQDAAKGETGHEGHDHGPATTTMRTAASSANAPS